MNNESNSLKGRYLKDVLRDAMEDCLDDKESTATERLVAITAAVDLYERL